MTRPDTPFPKHWLYYIVLKYAVIAAAVLIALYVELSPNLVTEGIRRQWLELAI